MFVGMPLFDTWEKFLSIYIRTLKQRRTKSVEDIFFKGISMMNIRRMIYWEEKNVWLTPKLHKTHLKHDLKVYRDRNYNIGVVLGESNHFRFFA